MSEQLQLRRGTAAQVAAFTGAIGEVVVDTDNKRLVLQDGATAGGIPVAKLSEAGGGSAGGRTTVSDANYTVLTTDRMIVVTALSAARTVTLCAASAYPAGTILYIADESGACSATATITLARAGSDTIDAAASAVIAAPFGFVALESNGTSQWTSLGQSTGSISGLTALGIGTPADPSNPLSVSADNILFNELPSGSGGTGDMRVKLNKASSTNTASFLFQDGFSGRAEIGLTGDDNFHFKVSPNGSTFIDALVINAATGQTNINPSSTFSFANKFRNGTMDVWQRGAGPITVATAGAYTADGWIVVPTGANVTAQKVAGRGPTVNSLKVTGAASVTDVIVKQRIESYIAAPLASQTVTVQAEVFNGAGASITPTLTVKHVGTQDVWTSPTIDVSAQPLQSCANGSWTQVAYTFTASSSSSNGLEISFDFGNNFGSTSNSIQITEVDIRVTNGVATGVNSSPPLPELRPIFSELQFCERYYTKSYSQSIAPGTSVTAGTGGIYLATSAVSPFLGIYVRYTAVMRIAPTLTLFDNAGNSGKASANISGTWVNNEAVGITTQFDSGFSAFLSNVANAVQLNFDYTASAEL